MPPKEDILAVATAENWVAVATTSNHLRLFDSTGTQKQIISLPGPIVCMSGHERKIFVTCHMGFGIYFLYIFFFLVRQIISFR